MNARRKPTLYFGVAEVAVWFGVKPDTVSQWLHRYDDTPAPDAELLPGRNGVPDRGWLLCRREEWEAWRKTSRPYRARRTPGHRSTSDKETNNA